MTQHERQDCWDKGHEPAPAIPPDACDVIARAQGMTPEQAVLALEGLTKAQRKAEYKAASDLLERGRESRAESNW